MRPQATVQVCLEVADIASSPREGYEKNQGLEVFEVIEVELIL